MKKKKIPKVNTPSKTSPKSKKRACMCPDGDYSRNCCNGDIIAQGIGNLVTSPEVVKTASNGVRTITRG
jgi:hypothetical protein